MALRAGDVVRLFDGTTTPQKQKLFVCVYVGDGWFFRVNSKSHWRPNMPLSATADPCLAHDCFVELRGVIEYDDTEVDDALRVPANRLGRLSDATLTPAGSFVRCSASGAGLGASHTPSDGARSSARSIQKAAFAGEGWNRRPPEIRLHERP